MQGLLRLILFVTTSRTAPGDTVAAAADYDWREVKFLHGVYYSIKLMLIKFGWG
jgi:hypothetical protein